MCDNSSTEKVITSSPPLSRIGLNSHKAGMEGLDSDKINQIILEASKGSKYYQNEVLKDQEISRKVHHMLDSLKRLMTAEKAAAMKIVDKEVEALEVSRDFSRIIVHVDMDAFYAAVEMRDNPALKDSPMAVGSNSMLSTSNYVARRYGVRAAMPGFIAKKLCPNLVIVKPSYDKYHETSEEVHTILSQYDPNFCPVGLDESYLDITDCVKKGVATDQSVSDCVKKGVTIDQSVSDCVKKADQSVSDDSWCEYLSSLTKSHWLYAEQVVQNLREDIFKTTGLTASAGIAPNKMLAKIASDRNKPNGQCFVQPTREEVLKFVQELPIRKICGIGKVTEKMLNALDITLCRDLYEKRDILHLLFSQTTSSFFLAVSLGLGSVDIQRTTERKSMSIERSFSEIRACSEQMEKCQELCQILADAMEREGIKGRTVTIKLKMVNFEVKSRGMTVPRPISKCGELYHIAGELLQQEVKACGDTPLRLRLMGVRISTLQSRSRGQQTLMNFFRPTEPNGTDILGPSTIFDISQQDKLENSFSTCPVCGSKVSAENSVLNQHVDECLNKSAINETIASFQGCSPTKSKTAVSACKSTHKRSQGLWTYSDCKRKKTASYIAMQ